MSLDLFSAPVRGWFEANFAAATAAQERGWPAIAAGDHTLILAPTGSGKTLAAFLWGIDRMVRDPSPGDAPRPRQTRLLYVSPLRALAFDVEKNLRSPIEGIRHAGERLGAPVVVPTVGMRTGDTPPDERRRLARNPPDILITTPESLYLMLTSQVRETLRGVEAVIVDEIHAVAATKRGAHLALTLERLVDLQERAMADGAVGAPPRVFQRIGLSATQRPLDEIARFLGGFDAADEEVDGSATHDQPGGAGLAPRPVTVVDAGVRKELDIEVIVPVEDMGDLGGTGDAPLGATPGEPGGGAAPARRSIWPAMHPRLLELIEQHRSTIIFTNARRLAERLATRLNELAAGEENRGAEAFGYGRVGSDGEAAETAASGEKAETAQTTGDGEAGPASGGGVPPGESDERTLIHAHHGSLSRERRVQIEDDLKSGRTRAIVATSSLELGIDMGAVDLVVMVESPGAVSRGLQRVGRAGHQVGEPSRGKLFPKHRGDLVEAAVVVSRMKAGLIEETHYPRQPLDVLAQQIVAMSALDEWDLDHLRTLVRRAANFADVTDDVFDAVLDLLAGRYPSEEFNELHPRVVWDRSAGVVRGRAGAQRLAVTSGGTIPDRGLFGVFLPDGTRVGELDEEMVYESRTGETFLLGASTWRIEDITPDRVIVTPAPGQPGRMPFWRGDGPGRPLELGRAVGAFVREIRTVPAAQATQRLRGEHGLDELAAKNLLAFLDEQAEATGAVPDDRTVVIEQFRDEIGDWRVCILTPFGAQVHAPWAMALRVRLEEEWGLDPELMWSDDGIVLRLPEAIDEFPVDALLVDPDEVQELIVAHLPSSAMFASRFRECAARALLLPRRRPDRRTPLWQQRQRAADLLTVAAKYPSFPILLETTRECLHDVFDVPALRSVLDDLRQRKVRVVPVRTDRASPMAQSLLFGWIAVYMYEGDAPLAERRAAALALDRDLLRELLGAEELRELIDPGVLADLELELQCLVDGRRARDADELHDLLRRLGGLDRHELEARAVDGAPVGEWLDQLQHERRALPVLPPVLGANAGRGSRPLRQEVWWAGEDAARVRDALGLALPVGLPTAFTDPVDTPLDDLVARFARTHGPFLVAHVAGRLGVTSERVVAALGRLEREGRIVRGEFRPDGVEREWCDQDVLRQLRRRSLAALRHEVEPVEQAALARFLPGWQGVGVNRRGLDALVEVIGLLQGAAVSASVLERDVLPARLAGYRAADLDALCAAGDVVWVGAGSLGAKDGRVRLVFRDEVPLLVPEPPEPPADPTHEALRAQLTDRGASFWTDLVGAVQAADLPYDDESVLAALWDLVWAGEITNDTLAPVRAFVAGGSSRRTASAARRSGASRGRPRPGRLTRLGPPSAAGRWSLVSSLRGDEPLPTEVAHHRALQLLERHGVLTREAALGEGIEGGFAAIYPVLKALEERGQVRRGYFVAGLGGAQFALPGAVDRLRSARRTAADQDDVAAPLVLAATDPAQPYGAALTWPPSEGRPARAAGAFVVSIDGVPLALLERGAKGLVLFEGWEGDSRWADALTSLVKDGRLRSITISRIDGEPPTGHPAAAVLATAGFVDGYRGLVFRG